MTIAAVRVRNSTVGLWGAEMLDTLESHPSGFAQCRGGRGRDWTYAQGF
jgi:hypothetical protein